MFMDISELCNFFFCNTVCYFCKQKSKQHIKAMPGTEKKIPLVNGSMHGQ